MARKTRKPVNTDKQIAALKPEQTNIAFKVVDMKGLYVRITPNGAKSFVVAARGPGSKQVWSTIGATNVYKVADARNEASKRVERIEAGLPPVEPPPPKAETFKEVAEKFMNREGKKFRTKAEFERILGKYVYPKIGKREFLSITRTDMTALLDHVEDKHGSRQADTMLMVVRAIMNWQATRIDDYAPPIVRGMRRNKYVRRTRTLGLNDMGEPRDAEIRFVWKVAEQSGTFGAQVRLAILTGQRKSIFASMKWEDISEDGIWTIPGEDDREKGNGGALKLPDLAISIIEAQQHIGASPWVFPAARGDGHFSGWGKCKSRLDEQVTTAMREAAIADGDDPEEVAPLPHWTMHDLRRTANSLLVRAGVREFIAERVLGHVIPGIGSTYNRFAYKDEKADALVRLAALVETIINPPADNVVPLRGAGE